MTHESTRRCLSARFSWSKISMIQWTRVFSLFAPRNLAVLPETRFDHALIAERPIHFIEQPEIERDEQTTHDRHHQPLPHETKSDDRVRAEREQNYERK